MPESVRALNYRATLVLGMGLRPASPATVPLGRYAPAQRSLSRHRSSYGNERVEARTVILIRALFVTLRPLQDSET